MLSRSILAAFVVIAFMAVPAFGQNGEWHVTGGTLAGKAVPGNVCDTMTLTINGSKFTAISGGKNSSGTVTINATAEPYQTMVFKIDSGDDSGRELKAIYLANSNTLQIAFSKLKDFPNVLRSTEKNKFLLLNYGSGKRQVVSKDQSKKSTDVIGTEQGTQGQGNATGIN